MERLNENATNEEIINKVNEIIECIYKCQMSMLEDEIRRVRYKQESDIFFRERILPILGVNECYTKNI